MTIYYSDYIHGQSNIKSYIDEKLNGWNKVHWLTQVKLERNPRRKISPVDVLDQNQLAKQTEVQQAIYISRQSVSDISVEKISTDEFTRRSLSASFRELKRFYNLLSQTESVGDDEVDIPSIAEMREHTQSIYSKCFSRPNTYHIRIPKDMGPESVVSEIKSLSK